MIRFIPNRFFCCLWCLYTGIIPQTLKKRAYSEVIERPFVAFFGVFVVHIYYFLLNNVPKHDAFTR